MSIEEHLESIDKRLEAIEKSLNIVREDASKMSTHIDFVEVVMTRIKSPFRFLIARPNMKELE